MFKFSSTFLLHFIHKRSLNTISTSTLPSPSVSTIQFLTNSCGLSSGSLTSNGRKLRFDEKHIQQYEAIIGFFKSHGFENSQIANLVSRRPSILQSRVSTNLKPKFEFLQEIGFVGPLLLKLILSTPWVLGSSLVSQLKPSFFFMKEILESDEQVTAAICRSPRLLICDLKEEKLRDVADFCSNTAKLDPGTLISYPVLFKYSVDKRLQPRHGKGKRKIGKAAVNCQQLEAPREWSLASARKASSKQDEDRASER